VKSGAKADRVALCQQLLVAGRTLDDVAAEMRRRWRFRPRESYRHAHGWSQDEVAARFTEVAARLAPRGRSTPMVGTRIGEFERWPNGGRRPSPYVLTVLAEVYGTDLARLLDDADTEAMPEQERAVLAALTSGAVDRPLPHGAPRPVPRQLRPPVPVPVPAPVPVAPPPLLKTVPLAPPPLVKTVPLEPPVPAIPLVALGEELLTKVRARQRDELLDRTQGCADEAELMAAAAAEAADFGEWAEATCVGPTALEQLGQDVRKIAREYLTQPPFPLLRRTLRRRNRVFRLLEGRQRPAQARELYLLAGRLCGLGAWMVGDLGWPAEAATHARTAWLCAEIADCPTLRGWVRATQSKLAYWDGRPRESAQLAEDGLRHGVRDSGPALLAGLAARGWARAGEPVRARRALRVADSKQDGLDGEDDVGGVYGFSEAQHHYLTGTTHLWLGEPQQARQAADRAVWLFELSAPRDRFYGPEALALIDSAIAQVTTGELDGAADRVGSLLRRAPEKRIDTIQRRLVDLDRMLRRSAPAAPACAALAEQLDDFRHAAG